MDLCADLKSEPHVGLHGTRADPYRCCHCAAGRALKLKSVRAAVLALKQGLTMVNSPGTIDSDYRGEIQLIAINLGREPVVIQRGQRIAQMIIQRIIRAHWQEVQELPLSDRQDGGFGHTDENNTVQRSKFKSSRQEQNALPSLEPLKHPEF